MPAEAPRSVLRSLVFLLVALLLVACGTGEQGDPDAPQDAGGGGGGQDSDALLGAEVERAIDETLQETGADRGQVRVVVTELVTWSDGSLGCPREGEGYTQALVDGYRIVLEVDGVERHYHGARGEPPFHCGDPGAPSDG